MDLKYFSLGFSLDGVPNQVKSGLNLPSVDEVLSGEIPLLSELNVRYPEHFKVGGLHENMHVTKLKNIPNVK